MVKIYPVAGKKKSSNLCAAFVAGAGASDAVVFTGVDESNIAAWREVLDRGTEYYYIDNSYFDATREKEFRVTKNALQHSGRGYSDGKRFAVMHLSIEPWHKGGKHIVVCPQSDAFMRDMAMYECDWLKDTVSKLGTKRELRCRDWNPNKIALSKSLPEDLTDAYALVTYSSAAAITALLMGVPVFSEAGAAKAMSGSDIDNPIYPEGRAEFMAVLADNQFTLDEMRDGTCWRKLNGVV